MIKPTFSIIIPVLNNLEGLQHTISSILNQSLKDYEIWVIDGKSNQDSQDYLNTLPPQVYYLSEKDQGIYDAMNKGIERAKGNWLLFLGSGDLLSQENVLGNVYQKIDTTSDFVFGNIEYIDEDKNRLFKSKFNRSLWVKNTLHHQSVFYNASVFKQRQYDLAYRILADYEFNLSLLRQKARSKSLDFVITKCQFNGLSKQYRWSQYVEDMRIKIKHTSSLFYPVFLTLSTLKYLLSLIKRV